MSEVANIALNLARNCGYAVFPCREDKRPATPRGFHDAETDAAAIEFLWRRYPGPLIGVAAGARSGIDVLDVDTKHDAARAWCRVAMCKLPPTRMHRTRSGGVHLVFRHRDGVRNTESKLAQGVDTRGHGGYVIHWFAAGHPCLDHSAPAEWPPWLLEALLYKAPASIFFPARHRRPAGDGNDARRMTDALLERLARTAPGQRHHALRATARTIGGLLDAAGLSEAEASNLLFSAILTAGGSDVNRRNATETIAWALSKGRAAPLEPERR